MVRQAHQEGEGEEGGCQAPEGSQARVGCQEGELCALGEAWR